MKKKCILCESRNYKTLFEVNGANIKKCNKCGLTITQRKMEIDYKKYHRDTDYKILEIYFKNIFKTRYKIVHLFKKHPGKVLDVGCATGVNLNIYASRGWEVWGVEPSSSAMVAKKKGFKVLKTTFENASLPIKYFDLVILNHTLEHMDNPLKVLKKVNTILRKRGLVLIDVPNFGSLSAKLTNKRWKYILPNEHNYHFTRQTLESLLVAAGYEMVFSDSRSGMLEYANPLLEIWQSLVDRKKRFFANTLGFPGALVSTLLDMGTSITVVGRK